jgi:hypothetical protein
VRGAGARATARPRAGAGARVTDGQTRQGESKRRARVACHARVEVHVLLRVELRLRQTLQQVLQLADALLRGCARRSSGAAAPRVVNIIRGPSAKKARAVAAEASRACSAACSPVARRVAPGGARRALAQRRRDGGALARGAANPSARSRARQAARAPPRFLSRRACMNAHPSSSSMVFLSFIVAALSPCRGRNKQPPGPLAAPPPEYEPPRRMRCLTYATPAGRRHAVNGGATRASGNVDAGHAPAGRLARSHHLSTPPATSALSSALPRCLQPHGTAALGRGACAQRAPVMSALPLRRVGWCAARACSMYRVRCCTIAAAAAPHARSGCAGAQQQRSAWLCSAVAPAATGGAPLAWRCGFRAIHVAPLCCTADKLPATFVAPTTVDLSDYPPPKRQLTKGIAGTARHNSLVKTHGPWVQCYASADALPAAVQTT